MSCRPLTSVKWATPGRGCQPVGVQKSFLSLEPCSGDHGTERAGAEAVTVMSTHGFASFVVCDPAPSLRVFMV